jgi:metallo-beta-lactamase family protein
MPATATFTITHHGATTGVTGSCHQLTLADGQAVLVDCGLFQGPHFVQPGQCGAAAPGA